MENERYSSLNHCTDRPEWLATCPSHFTPHPEGLDVVALSGRTQIAVIQTLGCHYTDLAIPALLCNTKKA